MDQSMSAQPGQRSRPTIDYYPTSNHAARGSSGIGRSSHHMTSHFQFTQPSVANSFVIHPQFVSEQCEFSKRLKSTRNLSHLTAAKGDSGLRYGSAVSGV